MCHTHEAKYDFKQNVFAHYMHFTNSFNSAQTSCVNHRNDGEFIPASVGPLVSTNSIRNQVIFMLLMQAGDSPIVNDAIDLATLLHRLGFTTSCTY